VAKDAVGRTVGVVFSSTDTDVVSGWRVDDVCGLPVAVDRLLQATEMKADSPRRRIVAGGERWRGRPVGVVVAAQHLFGARGLARPADERGRVYLAVDVPPNAT